MQFLKNHTTGEAQSYETKNGNDIIKTVSGTPPNDEVYHYATAGVVGNGSFGVVFQASCLETSETVRPPNSVAPAPPVIARVGAHIARSGRSCGPSPPAGLPPCESKAADCHAYTWTAWAVVVFCACHVHASEIAQRSRPPPARRVQGTAQGASSSGVRAGRHKEGAAGQAVQE